MKLLHTSDWHLGKVLKGVARLDEQRTVLAQLVDAAAQERVDAVLVAGDLFESAAPPAEAQALAWATLLALRDTGAEVVVVAGNHDNAEQFDALAPVFAGVGITMVGRPRRPDQGGVIELPTRSGEVLRAALLPFVSQRGVVRAAQLMELDAAEAAQAYAARVATVVGALTSGFALDAVNVVVHHGTVRGGVMGGGERDAQTVFDYWISSAAFPASASYVAMGHLHRVQQLPGPSPVWYPGSPIAVDFGEEADAKGALLIDAAPGRPAVVTPLVLPAARRLRTLKGTVADLAALASEVGDDLLRVVVAEPTRAGLAEEVRAFLPHAIDIRVDRLEEEARASSDRGVGRRSPQELLGTFLTEQGVEDPRIERLFAELLNVELAGGGL